MFIEGGCVYFISSSLHLSVSWKSCSRRYMKIFFLILDAWWVKTKLYIVVK